MVELSKQRNEELQRGDYDEDLNRFSLEEVRSLLLIGEEWNGYLKEYLKRRINVLRGQIDLIQKNYKVKFTKILEKDVI